MSHYLHYESSEITVEDVNLFYGRLFKKKLFSLKIALTGIIISMPSFFNQGECATFIFIVRSL